MEQLEMEIFITNFDKKQIKNDKTGEVKDYCMVTYMIKKLDTNKSKGPAVLSCYCNANAWGDLDKYSFKWVKAKMTQVVENNRLKLKIKSIGNDVVS